MKYTLYEWIRATDFKMTFPDQKLCFSLLPVQYLKRIPVNFQQLV